MSRRNRKPKQNTWTELQKAILANAHWQPEQAVKFCRLLIQNGEAENILLVGLLLNGKGWSTYPILGTETPADDARAQATVDRDMAEGYFPMGFYASGPNSRICLTPWFEKACAMTDVDRQEPLDSLKSFLDRRDSGEMSGTPHPGVLPSTNGWIN
jgi:hypothetical protein